MPRPAATGSVRLPPRLRSNRSACRGRVLEIAQSRAMWRVDGRARREFRRSGSGCLSPASQQASCAAQRTTGGSPGAKNTQEEAGMDNAYDFRSLSMRRGSRIVLLVADNHASRLAFKMSKALLRPRDEMRVVTVVMSPESRDYGQRLTAEYVANDTSGQLLPQVLVKGDERLADTICSYLEEMSADLLVLGSHQLCANSIKEPLPACGSFSLRLVRAVRTCPVLVVKVNSRGPYLRIDNAAAGLKVMVECQSTGRHLVKWLMDKMDVHKDGLFLAVTRAVDQGTGLVKETASRMLTNFSVQAGVNEFYTAQRVFKEASGKELPQAVEADDIDILAVQAPDCKGLPATIVDLLQTARTSVLVYRPGGDASVSSSSSAIGINGGGLVAAAAAVTDGR